MQFGAIDWRIRHNIPVRFVTETTVLFLRAAHSVTSFVHVASNRDMRADRNGSWEISCLVADRTAQLKRSFSGVSADGVIIYNMLQQKTLSIGSLKIRITDRDPFKYSNS